jgi:cell wall-associated NlpC family hydrolase
MFITNRCLPKNSKTLFLGVSFFLLFGCASNEKKLSQAIVSPAPQASTHNNTNHKAVHEAIQLQGHPYVIGGESPNEGFDCSGLVYYVYNKHGVKVPRDTWSLASQLPSVQMEHRQPGDLVFFNTSNRDFSHVGIYVGEDRFVHAPSTHTGRVMMSNLNQPYWRQRFAAVRRPHSDKNLSHHNNPTLRSN